MRFDCLKCKYGYIKSHDKMLKFCKEAKLIEIAKPLKVNAGTEPDIDLLLTAMPIHLNTYTSTLIKFRN